MKRRELHGGHRLERAATRRPFRSMLPRPYTPRTPPRQEGASLNIPQRPGTNLRFNSAVFLTGSPLKLTYESINFGTGL